MKPYKRTSRLGPEIQRALAEILISKAKDPTLDRIAIVKVDLSHDLKDATVFFETYEGNEEQALRSLEKAKGFLRTELAHLLKIKAIPKLHFKSYKNLEEWNWEGF